MRVRRLGKRSTCKHVCISPMAFMNSSNFSLVWSLYRLPNILLNACDDIVKDVSPATARVRLTSAAADFHALCARFYN